MNTLSINIDTQASSRNHPIGRTVATDESAVSITHLNQMSGSAETDFLLKAVSNEQLESNPTLFNRNANSRNNQMGVEQYR